MKAAGPITLAGDIIHVTSSFPSEEAGGSTAPQKRAGGCGAAVWMSWERPPNVNDPSLQLSRIRTLVDVCQARATATPNQVSHIYLRDGEEPEVRLTYEQLDQSARAVAFELSRHASPGARVLLTYPPGLGFVIGFFGCLYAGLIAVPTAPVEANRSEAANRARAVAGSAAPRLLLSSAEFLDSGAAQLRKVICDTAMTPIAVDHFDAVSAQRWSRPAIDADTVAYLQYSSGCTGDPKGVILTHRQVLHNASIINDLVEARPGAKVVSWLPMFHDMGLISGCIMPIFADCSATIMSPTAFLRRPYRWLVALSSGDTVTAVPNFALDLCVRRVDEQQRSQLDLRGLRQVIVGAERVRPETLERFTAAFAPCGFRPESLQPCYGLAEATLLVSGGPAGRPPHLHHFDPAALRRDEVVPAVPGTPGQPLVGCGKVGSGLRVVIADPDSLRPAPPNRIGEILVSGGSVGTGYWNAPQATADTFGVTIEGIDGSFLRTGDLGVIVEGQLFITGRRKDVIVVDGVNHHPTDLELTVELAHPALRSGGCAAVSVDERGQERVVVLAEMTTQALRAVDPPSTPDGQSEAGHTRITAAIRRALSAHHGLSVYDIVLLPAGSLPFTSSGKLRRFACREGYQKGHFELSRINSGRNGTDGARSGRSLLPSGLVRVGRDRPDASRALGG